MFANAWPETITEAAAKDAEYYNSVRNTGAITPSQVEEQEWKQLERDRWAEYRGNTRPSQAGIDKPHPDSYGAHLPLRSKLHYNKHGWSRYTWPLTKAEKQALEARPLTYREAR